jgi:hypothetical protein
MGPLLTGCRSNRTKCGSATARSALVRYACGMRLATVSQFTSNLPGDILTPPPPSLPGRKSAPLQSLMDATSNFCAGAGPPISSRTAHIRTVIAAGMAKFKASWLPHTRHASMLLHLCQALCLRSYTGASCAHLRTHRSPAEVEEGEYDDSCLRAIFTSTGSVPR